MEMICPQGLCRYGSRTQHCSETCWQSPSVSVDGKRQVDLPLHFQAVLSPHDAAYPLFLSLLGSSRPVPCPDLRRPLHAIHLASLRMARVESIHPSHTTARKFGGARRAERLRVPRKSFAPFFLFATFTNRNEPLTQILLFHPGVAGSTEKKVLEDAEGALTRDFSRSTPHGTHSLFRAGSLETAEV